MFLPTNGWFYIEIDLFILFFDDSWMKVFFIPKEKQKINNILGYTISDLEQYGLL